MVCFYLPGSRTVHNHNLTQLQRPMPSHVSSRGYHVRILAPLTPQSPPPSTPPPILLHYHTSQPFVLPFLITIPHYYFSQPFLTKLCHCLLPNYPSHHCTLYRAIPSHNPSPPSPKISPQRQPPSPQQAPSRQMSRPVQLLSHALLPGRPRINPFGHVYGSFSQPCVVSAQLGNS